MGVLIVHTIHCSHNHQDTSSTTLINHQAIVKAIIDRVEPEQCVEGVFLSGSLVNANKDQLSDVDLGIASRNSSEDFNEAYSLRQDLMATVGQPTHFLERGWEHCRMIAILYGKSQFPPIGLEVDIIFSQLQHVSEQMPYADYDIVFDRSGRLRQELTKQSPRKPKEEVERELKQNLSWFPFYVHDALKADERGDSASFQSILEEIRKLVFSAAAVRRGAQVYGSKRALRYLSAIERTTVEFSYQAFNKSAIQKLTDLYLPILKDLELRYQIKEDVERFQGTLHGIL